MLLFIRTVGLESDSEIFEPPPLRGQGMQDISFVMFTVTSWFIVILQTTNGQQRMDEFRGTVMTAEVMRFLRSNSSNTRPKADDADSIESTCGKLLALFDS